MEFSTAAIITAGVAALSGVTVVAQKLKLVGGSSSSPGNRQQGERSSSSRRMPKSISEEEEELFFQAQLKEFENARDPQPSSSSSREQLKRSNTMPSGGSRSREGEGRGGGTSHGEGSGGGALERSWADTFSSLAPWNRPVTPPREPSRRERLEEVAEETLRLVKKASYTYQGVPYNIKEQIDYSIANTQFYPEDSNLQEWSKKVKVDKKVDAALSILNIPTLDAARILANSYRFHHRPQKSDSGTGFAYPKTGVLNFASATKPGGGFKNGAEAQEESIARVSSLFRSLSTKQAQKFYDLHEKLQNGKAKAQKAAFYTHSMIYSPGVVVFRNDYGDSVDWYTIEVVSCAAVNAGDILRDKSAVEKSGLEVDIEAAMEERMKRILYLFEIQGIRNIVLGTFGTGVFKNDVKMVARVWAKLLATRYRYSFDRVVFAITGDATFVDFKGSFEAWMKYRAERK